MKSLKSQDYYEMLGLSRRASQEDIRKAFELCKHTYQDDSLATYSLFSTDESKDILALMTQAYEILNDPSSRREYDSYLSRKESGPAKENEGERMVASMIGVGNDTKTEAPSRSAKAAAKPLRNPEKNKKALSGRGRPPDTQASPASEDRVNIALENVESITGEELKKFRTMLNISLEELSERTKIRKTYLQYLEEEDYEFLPAPVYIKGFVSIIADCLGLPAKRAAEDYMKQYRSQLESK